MDVARSGPGSQVLPNWNLDDLYPGMQSTEFANDVAACKADAEAFEKHYQGGLANLAANDPDELGRAVAEYEAIEERMARVLSGSDSSAPKVIGDIVSLIMLCRIAEAGRLTLSQYKAVLVV